MRYLFNEYAIDTDRRELRRGADMVAVTPQVFDLLEFLIRSRDRVVGKDDLIDAIWSGRSVSDAALTTRLNAARSAIGDSGQEQRLIKTLARKGYRFVGAVREASAADGPGEPSAPGLALPDRPSIAVLPFDNMSGDPEQDNFADGVVEELTMALSRFPWLFVIARNSSFTYKGRAVDVKQVGRELGVRYVLEGSVRKAGNRIRIAGQLIDAQTGAHLWVDRFDGALEDIFALQDEVTCSVVGAIAPKLLREEARRAARKPTENLDAYDYYLRGLSKVRRWTRDTNVEALALFTEAIARDPHLACAYGMSAWCHVVRKARGWMIEPARETIEAIALARNAVRLGSNDPVALCMGGYALAYIADEFNDAIAFMDRGLAVNPNHAQAWNLSSWLRVWLGEHDLALDHAARAVRLNPLDGSMAGGLAAMAYAHLLCGRHDLARSCAEKAVRDNPSFLLGHCASAASHAVSGYRDVAQQAVISILACNPGLCGATVGDLIPFRRAEDLSKLRDALRLAGLPD